MLCAAKTIAVWLIITLIGTNLLSLVLRPIIQWPRFPTPTLITDQDPTIARREYYGRLVSIILGLILTIGYFMALYRILGLGTLVAAVIHMLCRLPDLLFEMQFPPLVGRRIMLSHERRPQGWIYRLTGLLWLAALPVLYVFNCLDSEQMSFLWLVLVLIGSYVAVVFGFSSLVRWMKARSRHADVDERRAVLDLIARWSQTLARIDAATDEMKNVMASHPLGMGSVEFEEARTAVCEILAEERSRTRAFSSFWPALRDAQGSLLLVDLVKQLEKALNHCQYMLHLYGQAARAFRQGLPEEAPSVGELEPVNAAFESTLDDMGITASRLCRHYGASLQEIQASLGMLREPN